MKGPKGTLPSQLVINPRNSSQAHMAEEDPMNQCKIVHILRLGKKVDNQVSTPSNSIQYNHNQASTSSSPNPFKSNESEINKSTSQVHQLIVPFSNRLKNNKQNPHMCTKKRKTDVPKKVFLATNISELLSDPIPVKYKDPGYPTIAYTIGQAEISRVLLDLGASMNCSHSQFINNSGWVILVQLESLSNWLTIQ